MIIDIHTHTPPYRDKVPEEEMTVNPMWRPDKAMSSTYNWDDYLEAMKPVDRVIVFNIAFRPTDRPNEQTAEFVKAHSEKFIGFLSVHPDDPRALNEIERGVKELGLRGIKLGPNYQDFDPCSERACAIYGKALAMGLPLLFHQGTSPERFAPLEYAFPLAIDRIAIAFPELRIVMAHMGHPWQVDCITVIRKHPNVYADISALFYRPWSFYNCMRLATEWGVLKKLLFASDFPAATPQETIEGTRRVNAIIEGTKLPSVPEDEIEAIIHRDSLKILGLD